MCEGVEKLNRLQRWVFDCTYNTDNNMLVCAPTGMCSGDNDGEVVMVEVFRLIDQSMKGERKKKKEN